MADTPDALQALLAEKLEDSLVRELPAYTPRRVHGTAWLSGRASAIIGMRRSGKTTFLHQLRAERLAEGHLRQDLPFINFEDERLVGLTAEQLGPMVDGHRRRHGATMEHRRGTWCFDEIQVVPGWERFVRRLLDEGEEDIFVTGSSAALLSREIATSLRGRAWEVLLHPFSFEEVLRHRGIRPPCAGEAVDARARRRIEAAFLDYLDVGGFPEVQGLALATRRQMLRDYVDVAMLRDVVERHSVSNVAGLRWLVRQLLGNAGGLFSVEKFHHALKSQGFAISRDTVHQLLAHLTDCFLVRTVWMEATSERQRMVNPRKAYPVDPGLIPIFDRSGRANRGHALEAIVLLELERRHCEVTYVTTPAGHEVDFLARSPDGRTELIQVCLDASAEATGERETRALVEAGKAHPGAALRLLTSTRDGAPPSSPANIQVQPAWSWLLGHD